MLLVAPAPASEPELPEGWAEGLTAKQLLAEGHLATSNYVQGALYMITYELLRTGKEDKALCVTTAFYRSPEKHMTRTTFQMLNEYPDLPPGHIVFLLADQECGLSQ